MSRRGWAETRKGALTAIRHKAVWPLWLGLLLLAGCATAPARRAAEHFPPPPPPLAVAPLPPPPPLAVSPAPQAPPNAFTGLEGWAQEDHVSALRAVSAACAVSSRDPAMARVCGRARMLTALDDGDARIFMETNFRPQPLGTDGLLTAYFTPVYEARLVREGEFTAPVRPRPVDLPPQSTGSAARYPDRSLIERRPARDAVAWMRPEDLFFLQIQGSGVLEVPGFAPMRAVFDGSNGAPFLGLAAPMREAGLLADANTSADAIHAWLADHRGPEADAIMRLDRRYVFFRLQPDDGGEPAGAAGLKLIPGRALAVDPAEHAMGEVLWVDASAPSLSGAFPVYRRVAMALDTGGAIKGQARADLYLGRGAQAGMEAGRVRHVLRLYRLIPLDTPLAAQTPSPTLAQAPYKPLS
jgi:membrane-bound lytic murein transglycosylase A